MRARVLKILPLVVLIELFFVVSGLLSPELTVCLVLLTEVTAFALVGSFLVSFFGSLKRKMTEGKTLSTAVREELESVIPRTLLVMVQGEIGVISAIVRFAAGRFDIPESSKPIGYGADFRKMGIVLFFVALLEIILADLACASLFPDQVVLRFVILAVSVYALLWVVGLSLASRVYPHYITDKAVVFRYCSYRSVEIPLSDISSVAVSRCDCRGMKLLYVDDLNVMRMNNGMRTNEVLIALKENCSLVVDGGAYEDGEVVGFGCSVDDPQKACRILNEAIRRRCSLVD